MNGYLIGIALIFQAASVLITTRNPYGVILFAVASIVEGLIIWLDRQKIGKVQELEQKIEAVNQRAGALEGSVSQLTIAVKQW